MRSFLEMARRTETREQLPDFKCKVFCCESYLFCFRAVHSVSQSLPVGARLNQFWKPWAALGPSSKVIRILEEGYTLPFWNRPTLTRSSIIISGYVHPLRNSYLNAVEKVQNHLWLSSTDFSWFQNPTTNGDLS